MKTARGDGLREPIRRKKIDPLVANKIEFVDYKDTPALRKFITDTGKILPARITGLTSLTSRPSAPMPRPLTGEQRSEGFRQRNPRL